MGGLLTVSGSAKIEAVQSPLAKSRKPLLAMFPPTGSRPQKSPPECTQSATIIGYMRTWMCCKGCRLVGLYASNGGRTRQAQVELEPKRLLRTISTGRWGCWLVLGLGLTGPTRTRMLEESPGVLSVQCRASSVRLVSGVWCVVDAPAAKYWHSSISSSNTQQ